MDNTEVINILSFCTGYAGLELGLSRVFDNMLRCVAVEIEAFACANLVAKAEEGKLGIDALYTDVKTFPAGKFRGCFDIITAGYPCQPFSHAGKRAGENDPRHLWPFIRDRIEQIEPPLVICENVAGHLSLGFDRVVGDLEDIGYTTATGIYAAAETGAPHRRERLFFLAYRQCDGLRWLLRQARQGQDITQQRTDPDGQGIGGRTDGAALAHPESGRCGQKGECVADTANGIAWTGSVISDPEPIDCDTGPKRARWQARADADRSGKGAGLGDRWPARFGQQQYDWECPRTLPVRKAPKPTGWDEYLARIAAAAKSELGGTTNGLTDTLDAIANRVDRLRLCGNGVSPPQAEMAINDLIGQIIEQLKQQPKTRD